MEQVNSVLFSRLPKTVHQTPVGLQHGQEKRRLFMTCGYGNAAMESWGRSFKVEAVHGVRFSTRTEAKSRVFECIEGYYNRKRLHPTLGYVSPEAFEAKKVA